MAENFDFSRILAKTDPRRDNLVQMAARPMSGAVEARTVTGYGAANGVRPGDAVAVRDGHDLAAGNGPEDLGSPTGPPHLQAIDARRAPQSQMGAGVALAEVAGSETWLRLQEARQLMLNQDASAAAASALVGYESASQFNREYRRLFGAPPQRDVRNVLSQ